MSKRSLDDQVFDAIGGAVVLGTLALGYLAYQGIKQAQRASRRPIPNILAYLGVAPEKEKPEEIKTESPQPTDYKAPATVLGIIGLGLCFLAVIISNLGQQAGGDRAFGLTCFGVLFLFVALIFGLIHLGQRGGQASLHRVSDPQCSVEVKKSIALGFLDTDAAFRPLVVPNETRFEHMHVLGATGSGKSTLLANMILQDMCQGYGLCLIDPAGTLVKQVLPFVPRERIEDVILFEVADREYPLGLNLLERVPEIEDIGQQTDEVISVFIKLFGTSWGPRLEHILTNSVVTLLQFPGATLLDIPGLLLDEKFRQEVLRNIADADLVEWWTTGEYAKLSRQRDHITIVESVLNKVGPWRTYPTIRNIVGQPESSFSILRAMRESKIVLVNLNKGRVGRRTTRLLGAMLVTLNLLAALARTEDESKLPFFLYVDEFYDFVTTADDIPGAERDPFQELLAQARKSKVGLIVANQEEMQLSQRLCATLDGNVANRIRKSVV